MKNLLINRRHGVCCTHLHNSKFVLLSVGAIFSCLSAHAQSEVGYPGLPDPNASWSKSDKTGTTPKKVTEPSTTTTTSPVKPAAPAKSAKPAGPAKSAATPPPPNEAPSAAGSDAFPVAPLALQAPKVTKHQIAISGDYFLGKGDVTLPLGFSLAKSAFAPAGYHPDVVKPKRDSDYFGGTFSYSYGQSWYVDVGYFQGNSSGNVNAILGPNFTPPSTFTIDEKGYQAYVRYVPKFLRGKRLSAYLRVGVSYVESDLSDQLTDPLIGFYQENVAANDLLGNIGLGLGYRLFDAGRFRLGVQGELEGFYGARSQDLTEAVNSVNLPAVTIDNNLYGGIGRATVRMEYRLGRSGLLRAFLDVGAQAKFTEIEYPGAGASYQQNTYNELLWGPYAKLGFSYSF